MDFAGLMQASPYHRWLGVRLVKVESGVVEVMLPYREEFRGDDEGSHIHGGIIATLADIAACFAVMSAINRDAPSLDLDVDYLRMVPAGVSLTARAQAVKVGRTIGVADVEIETADGRLVAVARAKIVTNAPERTVLTQNTQQGSQT